MSDLSHGIVHLHTTHKRYEVHKCTWPADRRKFANLCESILGVRAALADISWLFMGPKKKHNKKQT